MIKSPSILYPPTRDLRKGVNTRTQSIYSADFATTADELAAITNLGAKWWLNKLPYPDQDVPGVPFVPLFFNGSYVTAPNLALAKPFGTILGFNEPDSPAPAADMTPAQALALWPQLEATDCRLGSPVTAESALTPGGWLETFMAGNPRVDFIQLHFYNNSFSDPDAFALAAFNYAVQTSQLYNKPCWITELGAISFTGTYPSWTFPTAAQCQAIIDATLKKLVQISYHRLERYCWYPTALKATYNYPPPGGPPVTTPADFFNTSLTDLSGTLTAQGVVYRDTAVF